MDNQIDKILLLQRLIRSFYVRRQFEQVRQEYLKTLSDIEGEISIKPLEIIPPTTQQTGIISSLKFAVNYSSFSLFLLVVIVPSKDELLKKREELAIELLWIEQAIQSRKDYLHLKSRYTTSVS